MINEAPVRGSGGGWGRGGGLGLLISLVWISKALASRIEEEAMSLSVFYYNCICAGWRSGESARLTPMWPGFNSRRRRLSLLLVLSFAPRGFSPGPPVFPSPQKPTLSNSNSIWNARTRLNEFIWTPMCFVVEQAIYNFNFFCVHFIVAVAVFTHVCAICRDLSVLCHCFKCAACAKLYFC